MHSRPRAASSASGRMETLWTAGRSDSPTARRLRKGLVCTRGLQPLDSPPSRLLILCSTCVRASLWTGVGVFDALSVTERLGRLLPTEVRRGAWVPWDESHFMCSVYREINVLLLNMLCDPSVLAEYTASRAPL